MSGLVTVDPVDPRQVWDERYADDAYAFGIEPNAFLVAQSGLIPPGARVLMPGDGEGRNGVWLAQQGCDVHSVDLSPVGLAKARALADLAGVAIDLEEVDLLQWAWPAGAYAAIVSIFLHLPPEARRTVHAAMIGALAPGGVLILQGFGKGQVGYGSGGPRRIDMLFDEATLRGDFEPELETVSVRKHVGVLSEGEHHQGEAELIDAVFRRPVSAAQ